MSRRNIRKYVNDQGMKVALIAARDLQVGDRIMNTTTNKFTSPVKSVELKDGKQHVVMKDGQEAAYTLKRDSTWIIDASDAS